MREQVAAMGVEREIGRILDANLNRAREALRTIEDHARFITDDRRTATELKTLRHELRAIASSVGADDLLAARDVATDVGRETKLASEAARQTPTDVLRAAFGRLTESARVLGEYAKLVAPSAAEAAERVRYAAYELEQRMVLRTPLLTRFRAVRLYVIVTEGLCRRPWFETAELALDGGAGCLQLREKGLGDAELLARARRLRELTRARGALLFVNDRPDIAVLSDADGVHLGQEDLGPVEARRIVGARRLIGLSTHTPDQAAAGERSDADVLAVGPIFPSTTKPQDRIAGLDGLRAVAEGSDRPLIAIGGIEAANAGEVFAAGASCVCVCSAVIASADPAAAAAAIVAAGSAASGGAAGAAGVPGRGAAG